jgi:hypothetical protein
MKMQEIRVCFPEKFPASFGEKSIPPLRIRGDRSTIVLLDLRKEGPLVTGLKSSRANEERSALVPEVQAPNVTARRGGGRGRKKMIRKNKGSERMCGHT